MSWFSSISPEFVSSIVVGLVTLVGNKVWNLFGSSKKKKIDSALATARGLIGQLVSTAKPDMTVDALIIQLKGAAAIQLAKVGLDPEDPFIKQLVREAVTAGVTSFVMLHPAKLSLDLPILRGIK